MSRRSRRWVTPRLWCSTKSLIEMWARKEVCWEMVKQQDFDLDYNSIKDEFINEKTATKRTLISSDEAEQKEKEENLEKIKSIPYEIWKKIENWGSETQNLSANMQNVAFTIAGRVRSNNKLLDNEVSNGLKIIDIVIDKAPEILFDIDNLPEIPKIQEEQQTEITLELILKIVQWDKRNKRLKGFEYTFMNELAEERKPLTDRNKAIAKLNLGKVKKYGFKE